VPDEVEEEKVDDTVVAVGRGKSKKKSPPTRERPTPIEEWEADDVMAILRRVARKEGTVYRDEYIKAVSVAMGYGRLGEKIEAKLRNHLMAAVRRKILASRDKVVWLETPTMADYERADLERCVCAVMRKGKAYERDEVYLAASRRVGFSRLTDTVVAPIKSAIRRLVRKGIIETERSTLWRVGDSEF
jgi:hypothetical protein